MSWAMAAKVEERLRRAVSDLNRELAEVPIPDPPSRGRIRWGGLVGATAAIAIGVAVILLAPPGGRVDPDLAVTTSMSQAVESTLTSSTVATSPPTTGAKATTTTTLAVRLPPQGPIFGEETGVLLLFDDGIDGLTAVDADRRLAGRSVVEGQRAGDEQYSMVLVGDRLVVGWGEPHAVDIVTRQGLSLGTATVFVPAAEPNRVWMIDSGARIGSRQLEVWQVDVVSGQPLAEPLPLTAEGDPQIGVPGGLALQLDNGLSLWEMGSGQVIDLESDGPGFAHDVDGEQLVWCSGDCTMLFLTNTSIGDRQELEPPSPYERFTGRSQISPDGRFLAVLLGEAFVGRAIWILDRETGSTTVVSDPESSVNYLAWSPDSDQLFATSWAYGPRSRTVIWRYQISDQEFTAVVLPFGGALSAVVVESSVVDAYITGEPGDMSECRAPMVQPSGRSGICSFGY